MSIARSLLRAKQHCSLTTLASAFFLLSLLLKVAATLWLRRLSTVQPSRQYSYIGNDYPESWPIERKPVLLAVSHSIHYELDSPSGIAEWASLVPGDGVVHLGEQKRPYTVSMFHQLKCLDIIRAELVRDRDESEEPSQLTTHCLNYVKQMVMCHGDTYLEPFIHPNHKDPIDQNGVYECSDWGAVYDEVKKNQEDFEHWREATFGHGAQGL